MEAQDQALMEKFDQEVKKFYQELFVSQEPHPPVIEKIMYDRIWELVEH